MTDLNQPEPEAASTPDISTRIKAYRLPLITGAAGLILGLVIGGLIPTAIGAAEEQARAQAEATAQAQVDAIFKDAVRACGANQSYALVGDKGRTLTVEHAGKDDSGAGITGEELWCLVDGLDAPQSVVSHMEQTTAQDGRQTASWSDIDASWSYHPDRGMDSVFTMVD